MFFIQELRKKFVRQTSAVEDDEVHLDKSIGNEWVRLRCVFVAPSRIVPDFIQGGESWATVQRSLCQTQGLFDRAVSSESLAGIGILLDSFEVLARYMSKLFFSFKFLVC
jgi:hypothetical protein